MLRVVTPKEGHIEYLLGKRWYYLVPFDIPSWYPEVTDSTGVYRIYDPALGWTLGKLGQDPPLYYSNRQGYRCSKTQFLAAQQSRETSEIDSVDVIAIGDSFTHGDEVLFEEAWPYQLQLTTGWTVLNLGVGGYGIDQATLHYEQTVVKSKVVLLGLVAGDMERSRRLIYNFTRGGLKTKPLFSFNGKQTRIINQPAIFGGDLRREFMKGEESSFFGQDLTYTSPLYLKREIFDGSYLYRVLKSFVVWRQERKTPIYRTDDERLAYCLKIIGHLRDSAEERGARLVVVLLGNNNTFADRWQRDIENPWELMETKLTERSIPYVNTADKLYPYFANNPDTVINSFGVHYTPFANEKVASILQHTEILRHIMTRSSNNAE
ncbi:MAG: hypothetical protein ACE5G0_01890 [Rhodothermales bacterium]